MNFSDTLKCVNIILESGGVPLIVGDSGIGKTSLAKKVSLMMNYELITIDANLLKEGEIGGLPTIEDYYAFDGKTKQTGKRTVYAVHYKLQRIDEILMKNKDKRILLFIDEINRCDHAVQQELMNIILNREINGYKLPKNVFILSAMNPSNKYENISDNEYQVVEMDPAQENRFVWLEMDTDVQNWLEWGKSKDENKDYESNIHDDVLEFISAFPQYLNRPDSLETVKATPRSWERVSDTYRLYLRKKDQIKENILFNIIKGNVGAAIAQEFLSFLENRKKIIRVEDVFNNKEIDENLLMNLRTENYETLFLFAINSLNYIKNSEKKDYLADRFSLILQYYPNDLRLSIMKKIKNDYTCIYNYFLDNDKFIEAYFKIYIRDK
ncbi:AAA family ATPase [Clostridium sp. 19966]|uniref:AAA family ATPase n=1 Tax=Clostridium sp. 19966 TaxID=2768166 RepID=UPI0028DE7688|nr:AAA family ATPase [Clostridium sp. 19966]MDT8716312.1 AAA family ATPase [Clostridium sp. 19966]